MAKAKAKAKVRRKPKARSASAVAPKELPPAGAWFPGAPLRHPRFDPHGSGPSGGRRLQVLVLSDGRVLVRGGHVIDKRRAVKEGGRHWSGVPVEADELWDGNEWRDIPRAMADELAKGGKATPQAPAPAWVEDELRHERRAGCRVALGDGRVLLAAGARIFSTWDGDDTEDCVRATAVAGKVWQYAGDLRRGRMRAVAARLPDGRVMLVGGQDTSHEALADVDLWEPMAPEQAVRAWIRRVAEQQLAENARYPSLRAAALERARARVRSWGDYEALFEATVGAVFGR